MKYKNAAYRADEERVITATHNVAQIIGWEFQSEPLLVRLWDGPCFYEPRAHLLVVPRMNGSSTGVAAVQRDLRLSALLLSAGITITGERTLYAQLRQCAGGKIVEHNCLRFWRTDEKGLWLVTDPDEREPHAVCFRLALSGLVISAPPWRNDAELQAGLARAGALIP